ncbi:MAG: CHAD domain-containing protein [Chloroflexi bacterium]|nr:CHAD domain-containing protein [Chloroflexota bacterium]
MGHQLAPAERANLEGIIQQGKPRYVRRAALLLRWDEGLPLAVIANAAGLSLRRVRYWQGRFLQQRLAIFPAAVLPGASAPATEAPPTPAPLTGLALVGSYGGDPARARHLAAQLLRLYDVTADQHALPEHWRALAEPAAWLFAAGLAADPEAPHRAAQDIALRHELESCSPEQRQALACIMLLQRKKRRGLASSLYTALPAEAQRGVLALAALLRLAEGLNSSGTQSSTVGEAAPGPAGIKVQVSGPQAALDAAAATARADLWGQAFAEGLVFVPHALQGLPALTLEGADAKSPGVLAMDPMSEAGRKVLLFHFRRMLEHEAGTRAGDDIEDLHRMRVATRRMRAAFRVFGRHFDPQAARPFLKGLRQTAQVLGAVRDLDVFMEKATAYLGTQPEGERSSLDPLLTTWQAQRETARASMLAHLNSEAYVEFCFEFTEFLQTPGAGARADRSAEATPSLVAHVAPCEIYQRLAEVRALGSTLHDAPISDYHALRILCKHLRYTLEFFQEALGAEAKDVIGRVVALQDHLGNLQDAAVAADLLRDFLNEWSEREKTERVTQRISIHGVTQYLAAKQAEIYTLLAGFPAAWADVDSTEFRQGLALAVAVL